MITWRRKAARGSKTAHAFVDGVPACKFGKAMLFASDVDETDTEPNRNVCEACRLQHGTSRRPSIAPTERHENQPKTATTAGSVAP
jgi:hypothetical protein